MADNVDITAGSGTTVATDDVAGVHYQVVKLASGDADSATMVSDTNPLPIDDAGGSLTVDGTVGVSGTVTVDGSGVTQPVSGTVTANLSATDNAVLDTIETNTDFGTVVGGGVEAAALRVTLANDSTGVLSVDDGGGSLTIDGTVTETNSAAILADTAAMDTNLGTIAGAVSGAEMQVDVVTSALPSGAATSSNQTSVINALGTNNTYALSIRDAVIAKTLTYVTGTTSTSGDNTIIAAPGAGNKIVITSLQIQNESSTATTYIVKNGTTAMWRVRGQNQGDGIGYTFSAGREWRLGTNVALVLNLSGANATGYNVAYYTES